MRRSWTRRPSIEAGDRSGAKPVAHSDLVRLSCAALFFLATLAAADSALAQIQPSAKRLSASQQQALRAKLNESTLFVATSHPSASYHGMAQNIAAVFGSSEDVRILAVAGHGGAQNLRDLLFLRGVDMAIVPTNVLAHAKATEALGGGLPTRVAYITRLYSEELHLLVGRGVKSVEDLRGKKVAVPLEDGTAQFTAEDVFRRLALPVELVAGNPAEAVDKVRSGSVAAALLLGGKPLPQFAGLPKDGSLRLLGLPFSPAMDEAYSPAVLAAEDYPLLIPPGQNVETLAVSPVLLTTSGKGSEESSRRIAKVIPALFGGLSELALAHRHPKWREVNLAATLPGWSRFGAAEEWLTKAKEQQAGSLQKRFEEFLRSARKPGSPDLTASEQKRLFDDFVSWTRKSLGDAGQSVRQ